MLNYYLKFDFICVGKERKLKKKKTLLVLRHNRLVSWDSVAPEQH